MFSLITSNLQKGSSLINTETLSILLNLISGQILSPLKKGKGPDTCLLLDMSGSMTGEPFYEMMAAVRLFVEGNLI